MKEPKLFKTSTAGPVLIVELLGVVSSLADNAVLQELEEVRSELRKGTEAIVRLPASRVLTSMPPLQPLGSERHRPRSVVQPADSAALPQPSGATPARNARQRRPRLANDLQAARAAQS